MLSERWSQALAGYAFIAPTVAAMAVFELLPIAFTVFLSLHDYDLLTAPSFTGLQNYADMIADRDVGIGLRNTLYYTAVVVPSLAAVALLYAVMLNQPLRLRGAFRTALYTPTVTASVVVALVFQWLYFRKGLLNYVLGLLGLPADTNWLGDPRTALPAIMAMNIWWIAPFFMVVFLAALQEIPASLYEAATVDGASPWQRFWHIAFPLLRPSLFLVCVLATTWSLQLFDQVYMLTAGGPVKSTTTVAYLIYAHAFRNFRMGYAATISLVLFGGILILTWVQKRYVDTDVQY